MDVIIVGAGQAGSHIAQVLSQENHDVTMIDVDTLQLEGVAPVLAGDEDIGTPFDGELCGCNASGPDGITDLTLKFDTQEFFDAIGPLARGYHVLTLTGALLDGTEIEGQDCTIVVGGGGRSAVRLLDRATRSRRLVDEGSSGATDLQLRP